MKQIFSTLIFIAFVINMGLSQQCGNTAAAVGAAWDFYEEKVPNSKPIIAISKLFDDIIELYNNFPNNGPGKAGHRGINIPTHQPQRGTTIGVGARLWLTPPSPDPHVEITIKKIGGKAKTNIDVCITGKNRIQEYVKSYTFEKDAPNHAKTFVLKKVKDHVISIRINPRFGTNKFEYEISTTSQKASVGEDHESIEEHPSGLTSSGNAVSKAGSGDGIISNMDPHPENIKRGPEEHDVGGTYSMRMFNMEGDVVNAGSVVINHEEIPWLLTIIPDNDEVKFIKVRGEFRNNTFRGAVEDDPSRKLELHFKPNIKQFTGEIRNLLPNATYKAVKMKLIKKL